ncbi:MAG TPA: FlgD immunoglobulin-like domain containing protein, partial [Candidatus Cloacimonadota bacterium]|nr:FlgD immunoglobulin-like domain containing protein [Candidatus Cloacimonadota bacterium]
MKKIVMTLALLVAVISAFCTNIPAGAVSGTWTLAGSPYIVQGDIFVNANTNLSINEGVQVQFNRNTSLTVNGNIQINGNVFNRVRLIASSSTYGWKGLVINSATGNNIRYAEISGVKSYPALLVQNNTNLVFENNIVKNNQISNQSAAATAVIKILESGNLSFNSNEISNNSSNSIVYISNLTNISGISFNSNIVKENQSSNGNVVFIKTVNSNQSNINSNTVYGNTSVYGCPGLYVYAKNALINQNEIYSNTTTNGNGGGLFVESFNADSFISLNNNTIYSNKAYNGGGIYLNSKNDLRCSLENNKVYLNQSSGNGGGIYINNLKTNTALNFNAVHFNQTISGNGGGIFVMDTDELKIINSNSIYNTGEGLYLFGNSESVKVLSYNSMYYGNNETYQIKAYSQVSSNPSAFYNCNISNGVNGFNSNVSNNVLSAIINVNPGFVDKYSYNWHLSSSANLCNTNGYGAPYASYIGLYPYSPANATAYHNRSLASGWTWLSFPVLQRDAETDQTVGVVSVVSNLDPYGLKILNQFGYEATFVNPYWQTNINFPYVQSSKGYKVQTSAMCNLNLPGTTLNPNTAITLMPNTENWVGYFIPETMRIEDALGEEVMNELTSITTQYWSMTKTALGWVSGSTPKTLSFGDMVILTTSSSNPVNFIWKNGIVQSPTFYTPASQFTYTEQADYVPVYVGIESEEVPAEIGLFVNGECRGASVYEGEITQINAYLLPEDLNQEISFEFAYDAKAPKQKADTYRVVSALTMQEENIPLIAQAGKSYYYVKFGSKDSSVSNKPLVQLNQNYPNPFNPSTKISFILSRDEEIRLSIYNIKGQKVKDLYSGKKEAGQHSIEWDGKDNHHKEVSSGIYLYKLETKTSSIQRKMTL